MASVIVDTERCIGCGKCAKMCMKNNIEIIEKKAVDRNRGCIRCGHCVSSCPKGAIALAPLEDGQGSAFDRVKDRKVFDGRPISNEDLERLFLAMDHGKGRCEFRVMQGPELMGFMDEVIDILREKESKVPVISEFAEIRDENIPRATPWEGQQVLLIFADSRERAAIAAERMMAEGLRMGIRGFHSNAIMAAYSADRERLGPFFGGTTKRLQMSFVIGHGRRLVEPVFAPVGKLKNLFGKMFRGCRAIPATPVNSQCPALCTGGSCRGDRSSWRESSSEDPDRDSPRCRIRSP